MTKTTKRTKKTKKLKSEITDKQCSVCKKVRPLWRFNTDNKSPKKKGVCNPCLIKQKNAPLKRDYPHLFE
ncbi:MAG: hypothetical protein KGV56_00430 [Gammaproteobacteria bacterium]|nr:hypothetical protein [Gammaproteobacteria bacterium]